MDIQAIRKDFPVLKEWVYLDNAFVGLMPKQVRDGYNSYVDQWYRFDTTGDRTILQEWLAKARKVRKELAKFVHVSPEELAYTTCTGSGLNIAINGTEWGQGENTVFPEWEHSPLDTHTTRRYGVEPRVWKPRDGIFQLSDLEKLVDDKTRIVQISEVSYVNGFKADLKAVSEIAHNHGAKVLVDSTQVVGALDVDWKGDNVDYVSFAPYKYLMGPAGLAFLYVKKEHIGELTPDRIGWKNQIYEGDNPEDDVDLETAEKFEYGTLHFQGHYAMEKSLEYLYRLGIKNVEKRNLELVSYLFDKLTESGKTIWTPEPKSNVVSYFQQGAREIATKLKAMKIKVTGREAHGDHMRVSVHFYNTEADIDKLLANA
ncbi:MAG: aminotransferase class V-fold PLP-dependent enzyme [Candidatus Bathyarchaeota archaeon]|nr:aminotransferase class V-fold PLP-dependent enzyme [Candidatus Bathyarchaeota archaeon]